MAGFLVRCTASRKELGYVWQAGSAWRWRTADEANHGERSSQRAAVQVLRDAADLKQQPSLFSGQASGPSLGAKPQGQASGPSLRAKPQGQASGPSLRAKPQGQSRSRGATTPPAAISRRR